MIRVWDISHWTRVGDLPEESSNDLCFILLHGVVHLNLAAGRLLVWKICSWLQHGDVSSYYLLLMISPAVS